MFELINCPVCRKDLATQGKNVRCTHAEADGAIIMFSDNSHTQTEARQFYDGRFNNKVELKNSLKFIEKLKCCILSQGFYSHVLKNFRPNSRIFELGCASGVDLFSDAFQMVGYDTNLWALKNSDYQLRINAVFETRLPMKSESMDGVISSFFFEHLSYSDQENCLVECARILKDQGTLIFLFDVKSQNPILKRWERDFPESFRRGMVEHDGHWGLRDFDRAIDLFKKYFKVEKIIVNECFIPSYSTMKKLSADYGFGWLFGKNKVSPIVWNTVVLFLDRVLFFVSKRNARTILLRCSKR